MLVTTVLAWTSGCGGGGRVETCGTVAPCGGNPTGLWMITSQCANTAAALSAASCPTATSRVVSLSVGGNISLNPDTTYATAIFQRGTFEVTMPPSCLMQNGVTLTCAELPQSIVAAGGAFSPFTSVTCSGTSDCTCTMVLSTEMHDTGFWATAGTTLTLTRKADGSTDSGEYCVQGNELHVSSLDTALTMGIMGQAEIQSDIVAIR